MAKKRSKKKTRAIRKDQPKAAQKKTATTKRKGPSSLSIKPGLRSSLSAAAKANKIKNWKTFAISGLTSLAKA